MDAAVGSYMIQAWHLFNLCVVHHSPYALATTVAPAIYGNFFTHHAWGDFRWYIPACTLSLYARTTVVFRPMDRDRKMPLIASFVLIGFFIGWLKISARFLRSGGILIHSARGRSSTWAIGAHGLCW